MNRAGRGIFAAGGIAVAFGIFVASGGGAVFLAPLLSSAAAVMRPAGTVVTTTRATVAHGTTSAGFVDQVAVNTAFYHSTKGLQSMAAVTNLVASNTDYSLWTVDDVTIAVVGTPLAPSQVAAAISITDSAVSSEHRVFKSSAVAASTVHTWSVYAKADTLAFLSMSNTAAAVRSTFDLSNGTVFSSSGGVTSASVETLAGGWYRCVMTGTSTAGANDFITINVGRTGAEAASLAAYVGTGQRLYTWCAQINVGATVGTCVLTTATSATTAADVHTVPTTGWPTGSGEISVVYTPSTADAINGQQIIDSRTTASTQGLTLFRTNDERVRLEIYAAAAVCSLQSAVLTWTPGTPKKIEAQWTPTTCEVFVDGVSVGTGVATGSPASHDAAANLGARYDGAEQAIGHLSALCVARLGGCP